MKLSQFAANLAEVRSRQVLRAGFSLVLLIIAFIVIFGLNRLTKVHESLAEIVNNEQVAIEMLFRMQQASRERSLLLYRIASIQDAFERDEQILNYRNLGAQFGEAHRKLKELQFNESEKALLDQQWEYALATQKIQKQAIDMVTDGQTQAAQNLLSMQAVPAQNKILDAINSLLDFEIKKSHTNTLLLQKQQGKTRIFMITGGILAALFVGFIAYFVNSRVHMLISNLSDTAQELNETNKHLEFMQQAVDHHNIVSIADVNGNITFVNDLFCQISQYSKQELIGNNHRLLKSGMQSDKIFEELWQTISTGKVWQGEICNRKKHGGLYWVATTILPMLDNSGLPYQYISVRTDISSIKEAQQVLLRSKNDLENMVHARTLELEERDEVLQSITNAAQDAVIMIDNQQNITFWNPAAVAMFGYTPEEATGNHLYNLLAPPNYLDAYRAAFTTTPKNENHALRGATTELHALRQDGSEFPIEISVSSVNLKNNWHAVAIVRDITARKLAEEQLKQLATTDPLTGIYNRRRFNEVMHAELARAKRYATPLSLIIFDIDHFKQINDQFGHPIGDQVLIQLSALVSNTLREADVLARWGGEEFTILAPNCDLQCGRRFAEKLRMLIETYKFTDVSKVTCSFGITDYRENDDQSSLVKRADHSLYKAKQMGRNRVEVE